MTQIDLKAPFTAWFYLQPIIADMSMTYPRDVNQVMATNQVQNNPGITAPHI